MAGEPSRLHADRPVAGSRPRAPGSALRHVGHRLVHEPQEGADGRLQVRLGRVLFAAVESPRDDDENIITVG